MMADVILGTGIAYDDDNVWLLCIVLLVVVGLTSSKNLRHFKSDNIVLQVNTHRLSWIFDLRS